jgi:hypothetical protein
LLAEETLDEARIREVTGLTGHEQHALTPVAP